MKLNKPGVQFCLHNTIIESSKSDNELTREELLSILIDRLNADEQSTERIIIEDAIERAAKISKPLKALMVALFFRNIICSDFVMDHVFRSYGEIFKSLKDLSRLDIAYGRQMQCVFPMTGMMSKITYQEILLHNYNLYFRHCGKLGDYNSFARQYPEINYGIAIGNIPNMRIVSADGSNGKPINDDSSVFFVVPSTQILKKLLIEQGRSDMLPSLDALLQRMPCYTIEEVQKHLHDISDGWDNVFNVFQWNEVVPLLLSPVGNYLAMTYMKEIGHQPIPLLKELYNQKQIW